MSDAKLPQWTCEVVRAEGEQKSLLVGDIFKLACHGEAQQPLTEPVEFQVPPEQKYDLVFRKLIRSDVGVAEFEVVSYRAGVHQMSKVLVSDPSGQQFEIQNFEFGLESTLPEGQKMEPHPFVGPFQLSYPHWLWISLVILAFLVLAGVIFKMKRVRDRRALLERMKKLQILGSPEAAFFKEIRGLVRRVSGARGNVQDSKALSSGIVDAFQVYLVRIFSIPFQEWSLQKCLKVLKRKHKKIYQEVGTEIEQLFEEASKLKALESVSSQDSLQIQSMAQRLVDHLGSARKQRRA